jgi:hypothetical protein
MNLNSAAIHDVVHPTAAYSQRSAEKHGSGELGEVSEQPWETSQLNPRNRIDSLDPPADPLWRVDGCTGLGTQYYAVPLFLEHVTPLRVDVYILEEAMASAQLRRLLDLDVAFHARNSTKLRRLGICSQILRALQHWTTKDGEGSIARMAKILQGLPFGSRILFRNLDMDIKKIRIEVLPMHEAERELLSLSMLEQAWQLGADDLPPRLDISELAFVRQLHDSVCLVRRKGEANPNVYVLKALIDGSKHLFHELDVLLQMPPHPNVIGRPSHLVTKRCGFGNKKAVLGFLLHYHAGGNLVEEIPFMTIHGKLTHQDKLRWARQLTSAVNHVFFEANRFYPDLRMDNIVFSASKEIILLDFEQRGVWCEFGPPEINAIEYVRILASDDASGFRDYESAIPEDVRDRYFVLLDGMLPNWRILKEMRQYRAFPLPGVESARSFNVAWECLDESEREAAQVYMLGRALWCILEGEGAPVRAAAWQGYPFEPLVEFPAFRRTPEALRPLISRCTSGRRDQLSRVVTRRNSKMTLADREDISSVAEVLNAARNWWAEELAYAENFLSERAEARKNGTWNSNYFGRPLLNEVMAVLENFPL